MKTKLIALHSFSAQDWQLFIQAWWLLLIIDIALRTQPFQRVQDWSESYPRMRVISKEQAEAVIRRTSDFVDRAARRHLYPMTCLRRSLALYWLLSRQGVIPDLRFGVRRDQSELHAHAWLEYEGQPIGEKDVPTSQYVPLEAS